MHVKGARGKIKSHGLKLAAQSVCQAIMDYLTSEWSMCGGHSHQSKINCRQRKWSTLAGAQYEDEM